MQTRRISSFTDLVRERKQEDYGVRIVLDDPDLIASIRREGAVRRSNPRTIAFNKEMYQTRATTSYEPMHYPEGSKKSRGVKQLHAETPLLWPKNLTALVPVSRAMIGDGPAIEDFLRADLVEVLGLREDITFLRGIGEMGEPRGLVNQPGALVLKRRPKAKQIERAFAAIEPLASGGVRWAMFGNPETLDRLKIAWDEDQLSGTYKSPVTEDRLGQPLAELRVFATTQMPRWQVVIANMSEAIVADGDELEVDCSDEASYFDGLEWKSAFQSGVFLIRAVYQHDIAHRRPNQIAVIGRPPRRLPFVGTVRRWWRRIR